MKKLAVAVVALGLSVSGLGLAAPASAATWDVASGSFSLDDGYGATATVSVSNVQVTDNTAASGYVKVSTDRYTCSTQSFSGMKVTFFPSGSEPCSGTIEFSLNPQSGALSATAALIITSRVFGGTASDFAQGTAQKPVVVALTGCDAKADDAGKQLAFSLTSGHPDAAVYEVTVGGAGLPSLTFAPADVPFEADVDYTMLTSGSSYSATITAKNAAGDVVGQCSTNPVTVPWPTPGAPSIVGAPIAVAGGQVTVNYSVADPITVQGIEVQLDGGAWTRPGGAAPSGGIGGAFTVAGLSEGKHSMVLRSVGFDPAPLTTSSTPVTFTVPASSKPSGGATTVTSVVIGSTPAKPVALPPAAPVSAVPGTSNGAGVGTNGALAANSGDAGIDAPCLAADGTLYPNQYSTVGSQLTMAPNTHGMPAVGSFAVTAGALPPGMQLDRQLGVLFGVTAAQGSWATTITANFADGTSKSNQFTTRVDADPQMLQYAAQNIGVVGKAASIAATTNAPAAGTTYSLVCGVLPAGTSLDAGTGAITGTPTAPVLLPVPLRVAESGASGKAAASFIFVVREGGFTAISYPAHPHLRAGKPARIRPTVNGVGDIALFRMWKGKLPRGLHSDKATGVITGRPLHAGPVHTITIVAVTRGGALLTSSPMRISVRR